MELGRSDLHATPDSEVQPLSHAKSAKNNSWCQEGFFLAGIGPLGEESRVLFDHRPNLALDAILERCIP